MGLKNIISGWVNDHQRKRDKENVERANDMLTDLMIELKKLSGKIASVEDKDLYNLKEEDVNQYLMTVSALETALQDAGTLRLHVDEIDNMINQCVSKTCNAVRMDYPSALKYGMDAVAWGILVGRNDISPDQMPKEEEIVTERLKMLRAHDTCIEAAQDLDNTQLLFKKTLVKLLETRGRMSKIKKELYADEDLYNELMDEKKLYGPDTSGSRPDLRALNSVLLQQMSVSQEIKALSDERDIMEKKITALTTDLEKAKIAMLMMSNKFNDKLPADLKKLSEDLIHAVVETQENLDKLIEAGDTLSGALTSYSESDIVKSANAAAYRYEMDSRAAEQRLEAERQKREAQKQKTENINNKRQIITN